MKYLLLVSLALTAMFSQDLTQKELYNKECATCHMGFQPQFLPKRSWDKLMDNLSNHFDTDASLSKDSLNKIKAYLEENSSDSKSLHGEAAEFAQSIKKDSTPIRISEIPKFQREHKEVTTKMIEQKEVKSISNCIACHKDANEGTYRERNIHIPNFGKSKDD